ncbi:type II toxin-antitoxin system RnlB family antitoxin [Viridibacillus arvi]|uniref:type II toxin-antitoxin system RnlB family antitoxin n=1 Tax=Viridibacillus arvi TaxID=263475 RepID=UPI0034CD8D68
MQIKIKDIPKLIEGMNPKAVLQVGGGHIDYSTTDVELVESNGFVMVQESSRVRADRYDIIDVPDTVTPLYDKLVLYKSYLGNLSEAIRLFDKSFSGVIVIDTMFHSGNNSNRFLDAKVKDGKVDHHSVKIVNTERHTPIRVFSNKHIQQDTDSMERSVLTTEQKQLLAKGVSI